MENKRKRVLSGILIAFILVGVAIFIILAAGTFWCQIPEPAVVSL